MIKILSYSLSILNCVSVGRFLICWLTLIVVNTGWLGFVDIVIFLGLVTTQKGADLTFELLSHLAIYVDAFNRK